VSQYPIPESAKKAVVLRMIIPVFDFRIDGADRFTLSGRYEAATIKAEVMPFTPFCAEIFLKLPDDIQKRLEQNNFSSPKTFYSTVRSPHFLLIDINCPADMGVAGFYPEEERVRNAVRDATIVALTLHSSTGFPFERVFSFPVPHHEGMLPFMFFTPMTRQARHAEHLQVESAFNVVDVFSCQQTLDALLLRHGSDKTTFDKVLSLALDYHWHSFTLERVAHAFLILMVVFEALFKKESDGDVGKAAQRVARLLGASKQECREIQKEFNDDPVDSFCKIRNQIAHGNTKLDHATVASKYPQLHRHITAAIVYLLNLPTGSVDDAKGYYEEVNRIAEARFQALPVK